MYLAIAWSRGPHLKYGKDAKAQTLGEIIMAPEKMKVKLEPLCISWKEKLF